MKVFLRMSEDVSLCTLHALVRAWRMYVRVFERSIFMRHENRSKSIEAACYQHETVIHVVSIK